MVATRSPHSSGWSQFLLVVVRPPLASFSVGLFRAVGVAVGGDEDGVVEEPVEEADGGGVLGEEPAPLFEGPVGADA